MVPEAGRDQTGAVGSLHGLGNRCKGERTFLLAERDRLEKGCL